VSIEIEFTVQTEQFHPVRVAIRGENVGDVFTQMASITEGHREILGDYHASLKAAVLYGRDKALEAVAKSLEALPEGAPGWSEQITKLFRAIPPGLEEPGGEFEVVFE